MSKKLHVSSQGAGTPFSYDIFITDGFRELEALLGPVLKDGHPSDNLRKAALLSDSNVYKLYGKDIEDILVRMGVSFSSFVFPAGEENKSLDTVQDVYEFLINGRFERRDVCIALGGGVVGDLTGFAAATYLRGISFVQIPTSLLAQTDSSIGGKTGVDFRRYKNMVGAFHQPLLCYMNMSALDTLDRRQFLSGLGEIIKAALIKDKGFYEWLKLHSEKIDALDKNVLEDMIYRACEIKRDVVVSDPLEKGERALLNFGHTLGHAVERCAGFTLFHGECVVLGMIAALFISMQRGYISEGEYCDVRETFERFGYTMKVPQNLGISKKDILETVKSDKKAESGVVKFILLEDIGNASIKKDVSREEMEGALEVIMN